LAKYGIRCEYDGYVFASEPERDYYIKLVELKKEGKIKDFIIQPNFSLQEEFETEFSDRWDNVKIQAIGITPDYHVTLNDGNEILLDTKGADSIEEASQLRRKLFLYKNRSIPLFFIGVLPKYLGGVWVEVSSGCNFLSKLKNRFNKIYPNVNKRSKDCPKWSISDWEEHFDFKDIDGLFYKWEKTKKVKVK